MTPEQIEGLQICLVIALAMALICPAVVWVLTSRSTAEA